MNDMRKVTAILPTRLLAAAQDATGQGVTETLRRALETLAHADWSRRMLALEGRARLDLGLDDLRQDRAID